MRFTHIDVNFYVRYEGHQNYPKILSLNILRVFSDHHLWRQNWCQYVWTSLCQFNFLVNLLHSLGVWFFDIWHLFDNLTSFWHFGCKSPMGPIAHVPNCLYLCTPLSMYPLSMWPIPLVPHTPVPLLPICPIPLYPITPSGSHCPYAPYPCTPYPQWVSLPICPIPLLPHCPLCPYILCAPYLLYPFAPVGLTGHVPHTPCTPFLPVSTLPMWPIPHVPPWPMCPIAHVGYTPVPHTPCTLLPHVPHCPSPLSPIG